ncbi:MAG: hypothetical protein WBE78_16875 [Candidatus Binataceae bacterium]|jgi:Flp pilus assembly pilin Flp
MDLIRQLYVRISERSRGQTMVEYVLILAVLSLVIFGSLKSVGTTVHGLINNVEVLF